MYNLVADKVYVKPLQIDAMVRSLALYIKQSGRAFEQVVGIERGGLFISRPLAALLGLPHDSIMISCYTETGKRLAPVISGDYDTNLDTLIVDDLIDGGSTIKLLNKYYHQTPSDAVAVLFWNTTSDEPDFYVEEKPEQWLVWPWELDYEEGVE